MPRCARGNHWAAKEGDRNCQACEKQIAHIKPSTSKETHTPPPTTPAPLCSNTSVRSVEQSHKKFNQLLLVSESSKHSNAEGEELDNSVNNHAPGVSGEDELSNDDCLTWYALMRDGTKIGNWGTEEHDGTITGTCHKGEHDKEAEVETLKTLQGMELRNRSDVEKLLGTLSEDVCWCGEYPPKDFIEIITKNSPHKENNETVLQNYVLHLIKPENFPSLTTTGVKWKEAHVGMKLVTSVTQNPDTPQRVVEEICERVNRVEEPHDSVWGGKSPHYIGDVVKLKIDIISAALCNLNTPYSFVENVVRTIPIKLSTEATDLDPSSFILPALKQSPHYPGVLREIFHKRVNKEYRKLKRKHWLDKTTLGLYNSGISQYELQTAEMSRDIIVHIS